MCFLFIWEQTAICATYSINWLVFITEMKSVYSAVRTGSLNKAVCAAFFKGLIEVFRAFRNPAGLPSKKIPSNRWIMVWLCSKHVWLRFFALFIPTLNASDCKWQMVGGYRMMNWKSVTGSGPDSEKNSLSLEPYVGSAASGWLSPLTLHTGPLAGDRIFSSVEM